MRSVSYLLFGFLLLVVQAAVGILVPSGAWAPNLLLPFAIYLGVLPDMHVVRGAVVAFLLGYLLDSFSGHGLGLHTFVMVATFLISRGAGLNLFMRGALFQVGLTFVFELLAGGAILALRAIFERPAPFPANAVAYTVTTLSAGAASTALLSPLVYGGLLRLDSLWTRRREEGAPT